MNSKFKIRYATSSEYKKQEIEFVKGLKLSEGPIEDFFEFEFVSVQTDEPLERDLKKMVSHKVMSAYRNLLVPCIVEHAGIVLKSHKDQDYPGGLTQPMWDAVGAENFVKSLDWSGSGVIARAVVGYCDGMSVEVFVGETEGVLSSHPRGERGFYWDTVFCPNELGGKMTYAEICAEDGGLARKMAISQSTKAMRRLVEYLAANRTRFF